MLVSEQYINFIMHKATIKVINVQSLKVFLIYFPRFSSFCIMRSYAPNVVFQMHLECANHADRSCGTFGKNVWEDDIWTDVNAKMDLTGVSKIDWTDS